MPNKLQTQPCIDPVVAWARFNSAETSQLLSLLKSCLDHCQCLISLESVRYSSSSATRTLVPYANFCCLLEGEVAGFFALIATKNTRNLGQNAHLFLCKSSFCSLQQSGLITNVKHNFTFVVIIPKIECFF